jgi:hypothetical protein
MSLILMFAEVSSANRTVIFTFKHTPWKKLRSESLLAFLKANLVSIRLLLPLIPKGVNWWFPVKRVRINVIINYHLQTKYKYSFFWLSCDRVWTNLDTISFTPTNNSQKEAIWNNQMKQIVLLYLLPYPQDSD